MYLGSTILHVFRKKNILKKNCFCEIYFRELDTKGNTHTQLAENMAAVPSSKGLSPHCCSDT